MKADREGWSGRCATVLAWMLVVMMGWMLPGAAWAQDDVDTPDNTTVSVGEVKIELLSFGVGKLSRRGDWAGVRLRIQDMGSTQRNLLIRVAGFDADGDTPLYERLVTSNPGIAQSVWVYPRLPFGWQPEMGITVTVHPWEEVAGEGVPRVGNPVGRVRLEPAGRSVLTPVEGAMLILGGREFSLSAYADRPQGGQSWVPTAHEVTAFELGLRPEDLPDRWIGLSMVPVIVWGAGDPAELRGDRSKAIREWIERGGHLVVVLPSVGQTWTNPTSNDLHDLLPNVQVTRREGVAYEPYRPLLTRSRAALPTQGVVHVFDPKAEAAPGEAIRVLDGPDGACVVVRRLIGAGAVTLIGLDLNHPALADRRRLEADVFWHRVLGRRGLLGVPDVQANAPGGMGFAAARSPTVFDRDIAPLISMTGRSAAGVLMGFVVFALYWLVAGPLAYTLLKRRGFLRHAWLAFVGAAVVFTGLAWSGAAALRPRDVEALHLTFLDHVYGQNVSRCRMWASVLVPWYGPATLSADSGAGDHGTGELLPLVTAWEDPQAGMTGGAFPDTRGYSIDTTSPSSITVPARQTTKQIQVDWAGGPPWRMPQPVTPVVLERSTPGGDGQPLLSGVLKHELPGALTSVVVIVVTGQSPLRPVRDGEAPSGDAAFQEGRLIAEAYAFAPGDWQPGRELDLSLVTTARVQDARLDQWLATLRPSTGGFGAVDAAESGRVTERMLALAVFSHLLPPELGTATGNGYAAQRAATHGWDLARWFTTPCVVVLGQVGAEGGGVASPVPLKLEGERIETRGRTVVRWVYPLHARPPRFPAGGPAEQPEGAGEESVGGGG